MGRGAGQVRQASYKGLREDKEAASLVSEQLSKSSPQHLCRNDWVYERVHDELAGDAWLVGRVPMAEMGKAGPRPCVGAAALGGAARPGPPRLRYAADGP